MPRVAQSDRTLRVICGTARISGSQPQENDMSLDVDASPLHPVVRPLSVRLSHFFWNSAACDHIWEFSFSYANS